LFRVHDENISIYIVNIGEHNYGLKNSDVKTELLSTDLVDFQPYAAIVHNAVLYKTNMAGLVSIQRNHYIRRISKVSGSQLAFVYLSSTKCFSSPNDELNVS